MNIKTPGQFGSWIIEQSLFMCSEFVSADGFKKEVYSCVARLFRLCIKCFSFVFICKYLLTAGLREQAFNVTQPWPGILKFSRVVHSDIYSMKEHVKSFCMLWLESLKFKHLRCAGKNHPVSQL